MKNINIPNLERLNSSYAKNSKDMFDVANVSDFYLENNSLLYVLNNDGDTAKIKCVKNYKNTYKLFSYKTSGVMSETIYFLLDVNNQIIYKSKDESSYLKEWIEYLLTGGSYEKVLENNKYNNDEFDIFAIG